MRELWQPDREGAVAGPAARDVVRHVQAARGTSLTDSSNENAPNRLPLVLAVSAVVVVVDVVSKVIAVDRLSGRPPVHVIDDVLELTLTRNAGAAFSLGVGATVVFTVLAVVVAAVIVRTATRLRHAGWGLALGLLLGGALGNLVDRLARSPGPFRGEVVDWIKLPHWPVFNIADASIVVGAILAALIVLLGHPLDDRRY
jgi:signal peptidase II